MRNLTLNPKGDYEINLWLGLSLLDEDPHASLVRKLKEMRRLAPESIETYLEHANALLDWQVTRPLLINFLTETLVGSKPTLDKIEDCLRIRDERSNLEEAMMFKLEDFIDQCRAS